MNNEKTLPRRQFFLQAGCKKKLMTLILSENGIDAQKIHTK